MESLNCYKRLSTDWRADGHVVIFNGSSESVLLKLIIYMEMKLVGRTIKLSILKARQKCN